LARCLLHGAHALEPALDPAPDSDPDSLRGLTF
jgi:hypothetical protein